MKFLALCFCFSVVYWDAPANTRYRSVGLARRVGHRVLSASLYTAKRSDDYEGPDAAITDPILLLLAALDCSKVGLVPCATIKQVKRVESIVLDFVAANQGWIPQIDSTVRRASLRDVRVSHGIDA